MNNQKCKGQAGTQDLALLALFEVIEGLYIEYNIGYNVNNRLCLEWKVTRKLTENNEKCNENLCICNCHFLMKKN